MYSEIIAMEWYIWPLEMIIFEISWELKKLNSQSVLYRENHFISTSHTGFPLGLPVLNNPKVFLSLASGVLLSYRITFPRTKMRLFMELECHMFRNEYHRKMK